MHCLIFCMKFITPNLFYFVSTSELAMLTDPDLNFLYREVGRLAIGEFSEAIFLYVLSKHYIFQWS